MTQQNVYEQLADMYETVGSPKTPALMKILRLQFTPLEARMAVQIGFKGGKLDELPEKTGTEKGRLKRMLNTMADKGTMWIDPGKEDPTYRLIPLAAGGISETGLWCNIKFPFSVELGIALHEFLDDWARGLSKIGQPFFPVWAATATLPDDALPSENIAEFIRDKEHWSVSPCPCRLSHWLADPGNHCQHILETCIHFGDMSRWTTEHGMARALTYEEAVELLQKSNEDGLIHTLAAECICNCCNDCCCVARTMKLGAPAYKPSPFWAQVDEETCDGCKICAECCPVGAIEVDEVAFVNQDVCLGCGVCVTACKPKSLRLVRRPKAEPAKV